MSQRAFDTDSLDLSSFLTASGYQPSILRNAGTNRATFSFTESPELLAAVIEYERGAALPAKNLLRTRAFLFREAGRMVREGGTQ